MTSLLMWPLQFPSIQITTHRQNALAFIKRIHENLTSKLVYCITLEHDEQCHCTLPYMMYFIVQPNYKKAQHSARNKNQKQILFYSYTIPRKESNTSWQKPSRCNFSANKDYKSEETFATSKNKRRILLTIKSGFEYQRFIIVKFIQL